MPEAKAEADEGGEVRAGSGGPFAQRRVGLGHHRRSRPAWPLSAGPTSLIRGPGRRWSDARGRSRHRSTPRRSCTVAGAEVDPVADRRVARPGDDGPVGLGEVDGAGTGADALCWSTSEPERASAGRERRSSADDGGVGDVLRRGASRDPRESRKSASLCRTETTLVTTSTQQQHDQLQRQELAGKAGRPRDARA